MLELGIFSFNLIHKNSSKAFMTSCMCTCDLSTVTITTYKTNILINANKSSKSRYIPSNIYLAKVLVAACIMTTLLVICNSLPYVRFKYIYLNKKILETDATFVVVPQNFTRANAESKVKCHGICNASSSKFQHLRTSRKKIAEMGNAKGKSSKQFHFLDRIGLTTWFGFHSPIQIRFLVA